MNNIGIFLIFIGFLIVGLGFSLFAKSRSVRYFVDQEIRYVDKETGELLANSYGYTYRYSESDIKRKFKKLAK